MVTHGPIHQNSRQNFSVTTVGNHTVNCQAVSIAVTCPGSTSIAVGFHFEQHNYIKKRLLGLWGTTCWVCLQELIAMLTWPKRIPVAWKVIVLAICCDLFGMIKGHFKWLSDLQLGPGDRKVTLNHLGLVSLLLHKKMKHSISTSEIGLFCKVGPYQLWMG